MAHERLLLKVSIVGERRNEAGLRCNPCSLLRQGLRALAFPAILIDVLSLLHVLIVPKNALKHSKTRL